MSIFYSEQVLQDFCDNNLWSLKSNPRFFEFSFAKYQDYISATNTINCLMYYWQIEAELLKMEFLYFPLLDHFTSTVPPQEQGTVAKLSFLAAHHNHIKYKRSVPGTFCWNITKNQQSVCLFVCFVGHNLSTFSPEPWN